MDHSQLKAFLSVAELGSFTDAAEQLHLTQPAVTKRIAGLEQMLGALLFDRVGHNIQLTSAGQILKKEATGLLQQMEFTRQAIRNLSVSISGPLQVATGHHIGLHRLPPIWKELIKNHNDIDLNIQFMDSEDAYQNVLDGHIECAVLTLPETPHAHLQCYSIWSDELGLFVAHDHPLALEENLTTELLTQFPVILPEKHTFTRVSILEYFNKNNLGLDKIKTGNYLETIKTLVECGLGWSVLPTTLQSEKLKPLFQNEFKLKRTLGLIHHKKRPLSHAANAFLELLLQNKTATRP